jgi:hypothetical protein
MRKLTLTASTAMGIVIGALGLNILPVRAQMAVVDVKSITQEIKQTELYQRLSRNGCGMIARGLGSRGKS